MTIVSRQADETVLIGRNLAVTVTDIDRAGVRLYVKGQCVGGFNDGERVDRAFELGPSGEVRLGEQVIITIARLATNEPRVYLSINAPPRMEVFRKEAADAPRRQEDDAR